MHPLQLHLLQSHDEQLHLLQLQFEQLHLLQLQFEQLHLLHLQLSFFIYINSRYFLFYGVKVNDIIILYL